MKFVKQTGVAVGSVLNTTTELVEVLHDGVKALRQFSKEWEHDAITAVGLAKAEKILEQGEAFEKLGYVVTSAHIIINDRGYPELDVRSILASGNQQYQAVSE